MLLNPTSPDVLVDKRGRPYFLWDVEDMTLDMFRARLRDSDLQIRAYLLGKLMRQAKPDDVLTLVTLAEISDVWPHLEPYLGRSRGFWSWLLRWWRDHQSAR